MKLLSALIIALPALAQATTDEFAHPSFVQISDVKAAGTGCPPETLDLKVHNNGNTISASFAKFVALSPADKNSEKRRFCQVNFKVKFPAGWAFSVASTTFNGFIGIDAGLKAEIVSSYYFGGQSNGGSDPSSKYSKQGPFASEFQYVSSIPALVWSQCGTDVIVNMKTDIRLIGDGNGVVGVEKQKNKFVNLVNLNWRQC